NTDSHVAVDPLKADLGTDTHLAIDPLSMTLDLKPAVIDLCLTTNVGRVPNVSIRQPYHHHFGLTLFDAAISSFTFSGQQEAVIEELARQPKVAWRGAVTSLPPQQHGPSPAPAPPSRNAGGIRVRLGS